MSTRLSWLSFRSCQGFVLAISLPDVSRGTLQVWFLYLFFSWGAVGVPRARGGDAAAWLAQVAGAAPGPEGATGQQPLGESQRR